MTRTKKSQIEPAVFASFAKEMNKKVEKDETRAGDGPQSTGTKRVFPVPLKGGRTGPAAKEESRETF